MNLTLGKNLVRSKVSELQLCNVCYQYEKRYGKLKPPNERTIFKKSVNKRGRERKSNSSKICENCDQPALVRSKVSELQLCNVCYQYEKRHGKLKPPNERTIFKKSICENCDEHEARKGLVRGGVSGLQLCNVCYQYENRHGKLKPPNERTIFKKSVNKRGRGWKSNSSKHDMEETIASAQQKLSILSDKKIIVEEAKINKNYESFDDDGKILSPKKKLSAKEKNYPREASDDKLWNLEEEEEEFLKEKIHKTKTNTKRKRGRKKSTVDVIMEKDNKKSPWGIYVEQETIPWIVTQVDKGTQGNKKGVKEDWKYVKWNGEDITKVMSDRTRKELEDGIPGTITFEIPKEAKN